MTTIKQCHNLKILLYGSTIALTSLFREDGRNEEGLEHPLSHVPVLFYLYGNTFLARVNFKPKNQARGLLVLRVPSYGGF